jgi:hypothetical protein
MPKPDGHVPAPQTPQELLTAFLKSVGVIPSAPPSTDERKKHLADAYFAEAARTEASVATKQSCECLSCVILTRTGKLSAMICRAAANHLSGKSDGWNLLIAKLAEVEAAHPECFKAPTPAT